MSPYVVAFSAYIEDPYIQYIYLYLNSYRYIYLDTSRVYRAYS
nr:MAG TPA: hypothetical protein [Caudoviricetes sp.]